MKLQRQFPSRTNTIAALALCLAFIPARASERLWLANGFDLVCDHHALVQGHLRAYLKPGDADYVDLAPEAIASIETLPTPEAVPTIPALTNPPAANAPLTSADLGQLLTAAGSRHNVDEDLLASVVKAESNGQSRAISRAGAQGLMQLMPGTAHQLGVQDSFQPAQNVQGGAAYLDQLLTRYHDNLALALAAYNAGPDAVDRHHGIPPYRETRAYVARVIHEFNRRAAQREKLNHLQSLTTVAAR